LEPGSLDVELAFYGDLWRPDFRQPLPRIHPEPLEEGFPGFSDVFRWVDERTRVGDLLLDHLLGDVDDYFSEPELRAATNARVIRAVKGSSPDAEGVIAVGFSMGSLVAYDTLRADPGLGVRALITIGSPLATPSFYRRVVADAGVGATPGTSPTPFPPQLDSWVNIWTRDDPATAGHVNFPARFPSSDPAAIHVQDLETWGRPMGPTNPAGAHNALDYLSSRVFAKALVTATRMIREGDV
jgi:pimeloyl-ACP methyl ester carboxylesterase